MHFFQPSACILLHLLAGCFGKPTQVVASLDCGERLALRSSFPDIIHELGPLLSQNASVLVSDSSGFSNASQRWQGYNDPSFSAVVEVATESDVVNTVIYANNHSIPFLAVNGGHGAINSLGYLQSGVEIRLRAMNAVQISADGSYARIQGGTINKDVIDALWAATKQSTTGAGECSGFTGAAFGGGHGFLQGRYGLISDNIIEATVVLGNGSIVAVSTSSNPDFFYAIRGAGHNFGILTEMKYKIYDVPSKDSWYYETFVFGHDQVEALFTRANSMIANGTQPVELLSYAVYLRSPTTDPSHAVVLFSILYNGPQSAAQEYTAPFHALGPLSVSNGTSNLPGLSAVTGNDENSQICQNGFNRLKFPLNLQQYSIAAQRTTFNAFNNLTSQAAFNQSLLIFEAYSSQAVKAVRADSTAFAQRNDNIIVSPVVSYVPDSSLDSAAVAFGENIRQTFYAASGSSELHAYVNYAHGDETKQQLYGYESWRLPKLEGIKSSYDPQNHFRWFAPII